MIYMVYEEYKNKYLDTQKKFDEILQEKEFMFAKTQPQSPNWDKIGENGNQITNKFDNYLVDKESKRIDERFAEIKSILDDRGRLLALKEQELRSSKNHIDKIYKMKYVDKLNISRIVKASNYSRAQVYRILDDIKKMIN